MSILFFRELIMSATGAYKLLAAAYAGDDLTVAQALSSGVSVEVADSEMRTPLMLAAFNGHSAVVRQVLATGADVNRTDPQGRSALMFACTGDFSETVQIILDHGAQINRVDTGERWSALMWAAAEGHGAVVQLLLAHGADPALTDADGDTAYSFACRNRHVEVAKLLQDCCRDSL